MDIVDVISRLRRIGSDGSHFEAKACSKGLSKDVWESVSAFANTAGGVLLLGLDEKSGFKPAPGFNLGSVRDQFISGMGDGGEGGSRIANPPRYSIERVEFEKSALLVIKIDSLPVTDKPCYVSGQGMQRGSYKRIDDADIRLSPNEVYSLSVANTVTKSDYMGVVGAGRSDLDPYILSQAFVKAQQLMPRAMRGAEDEETRLKRLCFVDYECLVTKAGLLVAGYYPQQFFPKLMVDVAVHPGKEKASKSGSRFVDRTLCVGPIGSMISDAVAAVAKNLHRHSRVEGAGRIDELEIPEEVIREAIANALVHRDYASCFDGEAVSVDVFSDRVEVTNPGGLWGKEESELADGRSTCRNQTLMTMLSVSPMPLGAGSPAEGNGSGIPFMINESKRVGLKKPIFCPSFDHFKLILWRPDGLANPLRVALDEESGQAGGGLSEILMEYGELSARELADKSGLTLNQVRYRIGKMVDDGVVLPTASSTSRKRKYRLK